MMGWILDNIYTAIQLQHGSISDPDLWTPYVGEQLKKQINHLGTIKISFIISASSKGSSRFISGLELIKKSELNVMILRPHE